ncbi:MAG TPA: hypothetical protein DDY78_07030 [Planctomycetales bacterium]|jgi:SAM-dependent methyltransferase|nr:hypothetical protein [Planctomycetales bacterium]
MKAQAYDLMERLGSEHWWYRARREIVCAVVRRFLRGGAVLDYGCGTGSIGLQLREHGFSVVGADVEPRALAACREHGLSVLDLNREQPARQGSDAVLACDVLEHVDDDVELLRRLREVLRPAGYLIATVPAYQWLWSGEDYVSNHHRRYTRSTFNSLLRRAGYRPVWSSYFNTLLFPAAATTILAKRLFQPGAMYRSNISESPPWQNAVLYKLFAAERSLLRWLRFPFGLSIIVVAWP